MSSRAPKRPRRHDRRPERGSPHVCLERALLFGNAVLLRTARVPTGRRRRAIGCPSRHSKTARAAPRPRKPLLSKPVLSKSVLSKQVCAQQACAQQACAEDALLRPRRSHVEAGTPARPPIGRGDHACAIGRFRGSRAPIHKPRHNHGRSTQRDRHGSRAKMQPHEGGLHTICRLGLCPAALAGSARLTGTARPTTCGTRHRMSGGSIRDPDGRREKPR